MTEEEYLCRFAERLRAHMEEHGMTQKGLAHASGVNQGLISQYLNRHCMPGIYNYMKLTKAFNVPFDYLIGIGETVTCDE